MKNNQFILITLFFLSFSTVYSADKTKALSFLGKKNKSPSSVILSCGDERTNIYYFSPNYDGYRDTVPFYLTIRSGSRLAAWDLTIYNEQWEAVKSIRGDEEPLDNSNPKQMVFNLVAGKKPIFYPESFEWNGTSDTGHVLSEGKYTAILTAYNEAETNGFSFTNLICLKVTPPVGNVSVNDMVFSPNGDGSKDFLEISQDIFRDVFWNAEIRDQDGKAVRKWSWGTNAPSELVWDGKDSSSKILPDGTYDYILYGEDRAGNRNVIPVKDINLSTQRYSVFLSISPSAFRPGTSAVKIQPLVSETNSALSYTVTVKNTSGMIVRDWGMEQLPESLSWDGLDKNGTPVPDGNYYVVMKAEFLNGDIPESPVYPLVADTAPPVMKIDWEPKPFSPDGDGRDDTLFLHFQADDPSGIRHWNIAIYDPDGKLFKKFEGEGKPGATIRWDGRSDNGELVESAQDYPLVMSSEDNLGNQTQIISAGKISVDVLLEKNEKGLKIRINNIEFEFGKAELKGQKIPILDRVAQILQKYSKYKVEIQGHTDNIGSAQKNLSLSLQRAQAVYDYLAGKGISKKRMTVTGFGFQRPSADNNTEEGRRKNRRVEFILIKPDQ